MKRPLLWLLLAGLLLSAASAHAQSASPTAVLTAVDVNNFPEMYVYVSVSDSAGQHIPGLSASAFSLSENQAPVANLAVLEAEVGVQVVFVLDVNAAFKTRDAAGNNRLDYLKQALAGFVQQTMTEADDVTILTSDGESIGHVSASAPVMDALDRYSTEFAGSADPYALINSGLNFASDATPRPGMRRALVYIANGLSRAGPALTDLLARAQAAQIALHTVFVGPEDALETVGAQTLRQLSQQTNGLNLLLQSPKSLEPLFQTLAHQRRQYRLNYRSTLHDTGQHAVAARVQLPDGTALATSDVMFQLRVEAPAIGLPNLPARIDLAETTPDFPLPVQVNFPDGHPRDLREAQLLVDGQAVDTRRTASLAALTWPLGAYTESLTHTLQVRLTDELGLNAESRPVEVFVAVPTAALLSTGAQPSARQPDLRMVLAAVVVGLVLLVGGGAAWYWRARPRAQASAVGGTTIPGRPMRSEPHPASPKPRPVDVKDTMPIQAPPAPTRRIQIPRVSMLRRGTALRSTGAGPKGNAYLEVVEPGGGGAPREAIELPGPTLRVGRDPALADAVFPDRSVSRLHARIAEVAPGCFQVFDEGSTSGTWVNFAQIPAEVGYALKPGDLINLGRVQLRFQVRSLPAKPSNGSGAT